MKKCYLFLLVFLIFLNGCDKKDEKSNLPEITVVDVSQETNWDYWVVGKDGDYILIKESYSKPKEVFFKPNTSSTDGYLILFNDNGFPEKLIAEDYIFQFGNFQGYNVDIGVVFPDNSIQIYRDIETDVDWDSYYLKNLELALDWKDVVKAASHLTGAAVCAVSVTAAIGTAGLAMPLALVGCGATIISAATDYLLPDDYEILGVSSTAIGAIAGTIGCVTGDVNSCITASIGTTASIAGLAVDLLEDKENETRAIDAALKYGYGDVQITLTWNNNADIDLHVIDPNGEKIYWKNKTSSSGGSLDVDNTVAYGPENIFWPKGEAPEGIYEVYIHHFDWGSSSRPYISNYTVIVTAFGDFKIFQGTISRDEVIHITNFDQNGLKSVQIQKHKIITNLKKS